MERLKALRISKKISQQDLANKIGVSRSTIAMWETGKSEPANDYLNNLADFFEVSIDYLLGRSDIKSIADVVNHAVEVLSPSKKEISDAIDRAFDIKKAPVKSDKGDLPAMESEFIELFELLPAEKRKTIVAVMKSLLADKE